MKNTKALAAAFILAAFTGCMSYPTPVDRTFANVETNYVPKLVLQTNTITLIQTNTVVQVVTVTNEVGVVVPVYQTNLIPVMVTQTNWTVATNMVPVYMLTPSATATNIATGAGLIASLAAPGTGELVTGGILALVSIFLGIRNRQFAGKNDALSQAAGTLAQIIETGREIMSKTPQGQQAANAFTAWLVTHQAETNTIAEISKIVKASTNNVEAKAAADQILALMSPPAPPAASGSTQAPKV